MDIVGDNRFRLSLGVLVLCSGLSACIELNRSDEEVAPGPDVRVETVGSDADADSDSDASIETDADADGPAETIEPPCDCKVGDVCYQAGEACDDGDPCTSGDLCLNQTCQGALACAESVNFIFTTKNSVEANFGTLEAADSICNSAASEAGLTGDFRALLSDSSTNALQRLSGSIGPAWQRPDGKPVAGNLPDLLAGKLWYPPELDQFGDPVKFGEVWTGTNPSGTSATTHCNDWSSSTGSAEVGEVHAGNARSIAAGQGGCDSERRLRCVGVDKSAPPDYGVLPQSGRLAFVSNGLFEPTTGIASADALCRAEAHKAGQAAGTYRAVLAADGQSAISRFNLDKQIWVRPDGVPIVDSTAGLIGPLMAPISLTAAGVPVNAEIAVGALTMNEPGSADSTCGNWSSSGGYLAVAVVGRTRGPSDSDSPGSWLSGRLDEDCTTGRRVLCLQDLEHNYMFTTSEVYTGDLGGLEGADDKCNTAASGMGLKGSYRALLDDGAIQSVNARLGSAKGWVRLDGQPVASTAVSLLDARWWYGPTLAGGGSGQLQPEVWTGFSVGSFASNCGAWLSGEGDADGMTGRRTVSGHPSALRGATKACDGVAHLHCVQVDHDDPLEPPARVEGRPAFVSSASFSTADGIAAADALCNDDAGAAGLAIGNYKAILNTNDTNGLNRFTDNGQPVIRAWDGLAITSTWEEFVNSGEPRQVPLVYGADGAQSVSSAPLVATGVQNVDNAGSPGKDSSTCEDWSAGTSSAMLGAGREGTTDVEWWSAAITSCGDNQRVYCLLDTPINLIFLTQQTYTGDLAMPNASPPLEGLAAADALCTAEAEAAGYPGTFMAFLSTDTMPMQMRVGDVSARGWRRADGKPVADTLQQLLDMDLWYPPRLMPNGDFVEAGVRVWTGSNAGGSSNSDDCGDWIGVGSGRTGSGTAGGLSLTSSGAMSCTNKARLLCLQVDHETPVQAYVPETAPDNRRVVFVSQGKMKGDGGRTEADTICSSEASEAGLDGPFVALLATDGTSAHSRLTNIDQATWVRPDGLVVAVGTGLLNADFAATFSQYADGEPCLSTRTWTGSTALDVDGDADSTCLDWTIATGDILGRTGTVGEASPFWFGGNPQKCENLRPVYCAQNP